MKKNYRILNACPYCKYCFYEADPAEPPIYFCNQDNTFDPQLLNPWISDNAVGWQWEDAHRVSECGICDDFEYGPNEPLELHFYPDPNEYPDL